MIELTPRDIAFLIKQRENFSTRHYQAEISPVWQTFNFRSDAPPATLKAFLDELGLLRTNLENLSGRSEFLAIEDEFAPIIKSILLRERRVTAADIDRRKIATNNPEITGGLDAELAPFDEMLAKPWLQEATPRTVIAMSDYLTLEEVERHLRERHVQLRERQYDEKFHLLQAPTLLLSDIEYYRTVGGIRGNSTAVAYIDIDDFKAFNTKYGHPKVDRDVLPIFMRALESFTFARGHAYRFGGDEYVLLLANGQGARAALMDLQRILRDLSYHEITESTSVSIGLCDVTPDCFLSNQGIVEHANRAMHHAKEHAKGRVVSYPPGSYQEDDLVVVTNLTDSASAS
jgi:diguanylate cyclase (GGDEF)-like protein